MSSSFALLAATAAKSEYPVECDRGILAATVDLEFTEKENLAPVGLEKGKRIRGTETRGIEEVCICLAGGDDQFCAFHNRLIWAGSGP